MDFRPIIFAVHASSHENFIFHNLDSERKNVLHPVALTRPFSEAIVARKRSQY